MKKAAIFLSMLTLSSSPASATQFFFEHGLGANNTSFGFTPQQPDRCNTLLCQKLQNNQNLWAHDYNTYDVNGNGEWKLNRMLTYDLPIAQQAETLANNIRTRSPNEPYVLIGLSQGGLRARYALQNNPDLQQRARALVTFNTPHAGAPIAKNLPIFKSNINTALNFGSLGRVNLEKLIDQTSPDQSETTQLLNIKGNEPGLIDIIPGSQFINELNGYECRNVVEERMMRARPNMESDTYTVTTLVCKRNPDFHPIPDHVALISVYGEGTSPLDSNRKNSLESAFDPNGATKLRNDLEEYGNSLSKAGGLMVMSIIGAPMGFTLLGVASKLYNFDQIWKTQIVGSEEGDGVIPKESQLHMHNDVSLGGTRHEEAIRSAAWHSKSPEDDGAVKQVYRALKSLGKKDD